MGTTENPEYVEIKDATRPPSLRSVAAIPVPVPRTGPGKDSGVKANMTAYSARLVSVEMTEWPE
jgi:hypothetical protein